jgi:hypothetical protein
MDSWNMFCTSSYAPIYLLSHRNQLCFAEEVIITIISTGVRNTIIVINFLSVTVSRKSSLRCDG